MTVPTTDNLIQDHLSRYQDRVNELMLCYLDQAKSIPSHLLTAIRYSVAQGGKRLRPCLLYMTAELFDADNSPCDAAAMAVEYIHTYSLIHDDLPAMDDDDIRRGQPSCHIAFDEATAILAGDGLQSLAIETLAINSPWHTAEQQLQMVLTLIQAIGPAGMVGGQALDIDAENKTISSDELQTIHQLKTGALIKASILLGAQCAHVEDALTLNALSQYGQHIGLAFQIHDDILDVSQDTQTLGKPSQSDQQANKSTYVSTLGFEQAQQLRDQHVQQAIDALKRLSVNTDALQKLTHYLAQRVH
ncbi:MAG: polyprenyl synthetase family protein [Coxiellaceae bacterium]|nr:polyprenyl synthetase family protein [Coxiellaceae bacterium]